MEHSNGTMKRRVQIYPEHPLSMTIEEYVNWRKEQTWRERRKLPGVSEIEEMLTYLYVIGEGLPKADLKILVLNTDDPEHPNVHYLSQGKIIQTVSISPINKD